MSWKTISTKTTKEYSLANDGTGTMKPKVSGDKYLRSHYVLRYIVTVKQDSDNEYKYRVECDVDVANCYSGWGGEWSANAEAYQGTVYVNGTKKSSKKLPGRGLSCHGSSKNNWQSVLKASDFYYEFNAKSYADGGTASLDIGFEVECWQSGAGRAGSTSNLSSSKQLVKSDDGQTYTPTNASNARYSAGFHGKISKGITIELYKKPTITLTNATTGETSIYNQNRVITIGKNTSGDSTATNVTLNINNNDVSTSIGNNGKTYTFKPSTYGVSDAATYKVKATRTHSKKTSLSASATITLRTYTSPRIKDMSLNSTTFSGTGNGIVYWYTNQRQWGTSIEKDFVTYYQFGNKGWKTTGVNGPTSSQATNKETYKKQNMNITSSIINSNFTDAERCVDKISTTLYLKRVNPTSGIEASVSSDIVIQLTPKYSVTNLKYIDTKTNTEISPGSDVLTDDIPNVKIQWDYSTAVDAGMVDGYLVEIYSDSSYSTKVYSTFTTSKNITLQTKNITHMTRGVLNYVRILPYHIQPNTSKTKAYGPELKQKFILPLSKLATPRISYPINNTIWHNKNFRVLFQLPTDGDSDVLAPQINNDTYIYNDIELVINGKSYLYSKLPNIFSVEKLGYQYKVCINPSLVSALEDTTVYRIKVRVQKYYYRNIWSEYSTEITLNVSNISKINIEAGQKVLVNHYNTMRDYSIRLRSVYPINNIPENNIRLNQYDIINHINYQAIYDTITGIQTGVNGWAKFGSTKSSVKFNDLITTMTGDTNKPKSKTDIITADDDKRPTIQGRNYINILINCMNKLH